MLSLSKHLAIIVLAAVVAFCATVRAETETIDLKALAKKARPAVMLLVVSDATGKEIATGTGFLVSSDGKLITNHHVIEGATSAVAKAENGGLFPVEGVLADDPKNDLVLLKVKGKDLPFLTLGNGDKIEVGTRIAVIGSPLGLEGTLSEGIVSAVRDLMSDMKVLQVTAAISPGSSGSPVMDAKGDVVGIASALLRGGQALNFAVPVECGVRLIAEVKASSIPQALNQFANTRDDDISFSDPDCRAFFEAQFSGNYAEMLKCAKKLVTRYPDKDNSWSMLGTTFETLNFYDDAIAAYRQAIKIKPDDAFQWNCLGNVCLKAGRIDDATVAYRQVVKLKPDDPFAWISLAEAYTKAGHADDAIAALHQAIKLKPDSAGKWFGLALAFQRVGKKSDADAALQRARDMDPLLRNVQLP